ncbi:MAG: nucleotidyltransferase domain-containing protein [Candidatus Hydrogenedentota bacterium]|nr:MAG: nucleotidyltransferase domain-containing protein [Candidatus Hydrogenedentota bacterium]
MEPDKDPVVREIVGEAAKVEGIAWVVLFGSRGRGDHNRRSDYDIAISAPLLSRQDWTFFASHLRDTVRTLCCLDLVRWEDPLDPELRREIERGIRVYAA